MEEGNQSPRNNNNNKDEEAQLKWSPASPTRAKTERKRHSLSGIPSSKSPIATIRSKVRSASANFTLRLSRSPIMNTAAAIQYVDDLLLK